MISKAEFKGQYGEVKNEFLRGLERPEGVGERWWLIKVREIHAYVVHGQY
jgi:hypothetical protein